MISDRNQKRIIECGADMSGLQVDANRPRPPLTPLTLVSHLLTEIFGIRQIPFGMSIGRSSFFYIFIHGHSNTMIVMLYNSPVCEQCPFPSNGPKVDRFTTMVLFVETFHGLAVSFFTNFDEIINVNQNLAFRSVFV